MDLPRRFGKTAIVSLPKVLTIFLPQDEGVAPLQGLAEIVPGPGGGFQMAREEALEKITDCVGVVSQSELRIDAELLDRAPKLKIAANVAIGTDNFDLDFMASRGVWATNAHEPLVDPTADCALGLIISLARRLGEAERFVRADQWKRTQHGRWNGVLLSGKTLGLIGYGKIGHAVAKRARAFGMSVVHHRQKTTDDSESRDLEALLSEADFISLHTPLTTKTHHLIDAERLGQMKKGAFLINTGRGPVVDEEALVVALESGHLGGAVLDVFEREPAINPGLFGRENVILLPHLGGSATESRLEALKMCAQNIAAILKGENPPNAVNRPV